MTAPAPEITFFFKMNWKKHPESSEPAHNDELVGKMKQKHQCCSKVQKKLSKWHPERHLKLIRNRQWIPGCPFCCSYGLPGLPQGAKVLPQGVKMKPPKPIN